MEYKEDDYLLLSGIQHFLFCRRQWALIHIEQHWADNYHTADGMVMHKNVHNNNFRSARGNIITIRALRVHSSKLGISGECDAVEFHSDENGISLSKTEGLWKPYPVEYKRGSSKNGIYDKAQLCAQAMCLEEMLCCSINEGAIYYGETRRRESILFTEDLREKVYQACIEMHQLYEKGYTPKAKMKKGCNACSLKEICVPQLMCTQSVDDYIKESL